MANGTIYRMIPRVDEEVLVGLRGLTVADVHDALPASVRSAGLLEERMQSRTPGFRICGHAVTAFCSPGDSMMAHCALYCASRGDVIVISNGGVPLGALWGGNVSFDAKTFGIAGTVVDAPVRDVAFIRELQYPVWASSVSVTRSEKYGCGFVNMPVSCGGKIVNPGDIVFADDDGVLVVGVEHVRAVVSKVRRRMMLETDVRQRISEGSRLFDTQGFGGLLETNGVRVHDMAWDGRLGRNHT